MLSKKAFAMQFSWIFILIVGFLILLFTVTAIKKQSKVSELDVNVDIVKNLESVLTSAQQSSNTFKKINVPLLDLRYFCEDNVSTLSVNSKFRNLDDLFIFAPRHIRGKTLFSWSQDYFMPMHITKFLFLATKKNLFIFINSSLINYVYSFIPGNLSLLMLNSVDEFSYSDYPNYDSYIFVSDEPSVVSFPPSSSKLITRANLIVINTSQQNPDIGTINFYELSNPINPRWTHSGNSYFISRSLLYGAIFLPYKQDYDCVVNQILKKSLLIYKIYNYTVSKEANYTDSYVCKSFYYPSALDNLNNMIDAITDFNLTDIYDSSLYLRTANDNLKRNACPIIY